MDKYERREKKEKVLMIAALLASGQPVFRALDIAEALYDEVERRYSEPAEVTDATDLR